MGDQVTALGLGNDIGTAFRRNIVNHYPTWESDKIETLVNYIKDIANDTAEVYAEYECHYLINSTVSRAMMSRYLSLKFPALMTLTNDFTEFYAAPITDSIKRTFDHSGDTFSMSENQPIDATENITTPYIKVKGKNSYGYTDTTEHDTIEEYEKRYNLSERTRLTIEQIIDDMIKSVLYEYNISY